MKCIYEIYVYEIYRMYIQIYTIYEMHMKYIHKNIYKMHMKYIHEIYIYFNFPQNRVGPKI